MRAREFIVEYDRGMTLKSWEQKLTARMASDQSAPETIDEIMEMIESSDPTRNKMYTQWIVKRYVAGDFAADDLDQVNLRLTDYDAVKKALITGKDINQLTYAQLPDIISAGQAQKSAPKFEIIPDTEVLYNGPDGQLAIPKTEEASRALGSGTAWCTAYTDRHTMFSYYNATGNLYTWRAKNGDKFQFYWGRDIQFMNSANKPMSPKDMNFFRSINPPTKKLFEKYEAKFIEENEYSRIIKLAEALANSRVRWELAKPIIDIDRDAKNAFEYLLNNKMDDPARALVHIIKSPAYSFKYANEILDKKPFPAGEAVIAKDPTYAYQYAEAILKGPFPAGEAVIAKDATSSLNYAFICDRPFPVGEAAIAKDASSSYTYAKYILFDRFLKGEPAIKLDNDVYQEYKNDIIDGFWGKGKSTVFNILSKSSEASLDYALTMDKRFPEGEPAIAQDHDTACTYAMAIIEEEWPEGEAAIATDKRSSFKYAMFVLKTKRFLAGEAVIATSPELAKQYDEKFGTNLAQQ